VKEAGRIIVFSPHPDDETLGCGGTIAKMVKSGREVYIVFMTDGRNSHKYVLGIHDNPSPEELALIRKREAFNAAKVLGMDESKLIFLDFEDGSLKRNIPNIKKEIKKILIAINPSDVYIPLNDAHKDHIITNLVVRLCIKELKINPKIWEYPIYMDLRGKTGINIFILDIHDVIELKRRAINTYKSQIDTFFPSQNKPVLPQNFLQRFYEPKEIFIMRQRDCLACLRIILSFVEKCLRSGILGFYLLFVSFKLLQLLLRFKIIIFIILKVLRGARW